MLFPSSFPLAYKQKSIKLDQSLSKNQRQEAFEAFIESYKVEFFANNQNLNSENIIVKSFQRPDFGSFLLLENPFDREIIFDKSNMRKGFELEKAFSSHTIGSRVLGHFAELSISVKLYKKQDAIIFRNKFSGGKTMAFAEQVDYLELSLYEYVPILLNFFLEALYQRSIVGIEIELLDFGFDSVGTSPSYIKFAIRACLDDIFGK